MGNSINGVDVPADLVSKVEELDGIIAAAHVPYNIALDRADEDGLVYKFVDSDIDFALVLHGEAFFVTTPALDDSDADFEPVYTFDPEYPLTAEDFAERLTDFVNLAVNWQEVSELPFVAENPEYFGPSDKPNSILLYEDGYRYELLFVENGDHLVLARPIDTEAYEVDPDEDEDEIPLVYTNHHMLHPTMGSAFIVMLAETFGLPAEEEALLAPLRILLTPTN